MDNKKTLLAVYSILSTITCLFLISELKDRNEQLNEEIQIKYEYSMVIDSLMTEKESEMESMRHWREEFERDYLQKK